MDQVPFLEAGAHGGKKGLPAPGDGDYPDLVRDRKVLDCSPHQEWRGLSLHQIHLAAAKGVDCSQLGEGEKVGQTLDAKSDG